MCLSSAAAIRSSFCVVLNTQRFFASSGSTTADVPTVAISGTFASAMTSRIANAFGVVDGPISASMLFSLRSASWRSAPRASCRRRPRAGSIRRRAAADLGQQFAVFFCGMPIADVGPVADTISPILTCAVAPCGDSARAATMVSKRTRHLRSPAQALVWGSES